MSEPRLKWKLDPLLEREGVSVYALNKKLVEAGKSVSRTTLYRLACQQPERIDLEVAGRVLWGLEQLTGRHFDIAELIEYQAEPELKDEGSEAWLDSDLSRLGEFEPYDWEEGEAEEGEPVRYEPGVGIVAGNG
ncbi:MAG: hypothetical protein WD273_07520 [Trueperaceae bacterium]